MDNQYLYNNQSTMQKEINAKYLIASKELQNLYKRSTMIEPLLQILEDIYSKEDEGAAIAPLSLSINQIKSLNADIKTCLLNVKEKKSGPFQRIIKNKGENFDALESKMDKLVKDLEVALINAEQAAKANSEKKKQQKAKANNYNNNNYPQNNYNEQAQPTKYSLTDNYPQDYYNNTENYNNNYNYNNNATNNYNYQEPNNYGNNNNNNNATLDANLANQFSYLNVNEGNNTSNNLQTNEESNSNKNQYGYDNNVNNEQGQNQAQPQINIQPPDYQASQDSYNNYPQDNSNQFYNTYTNPSQQYYYGTLTKNDQQQQQQMNNYNQYPQQNQQMMYNDNNQMQMQQMQMQQMQMQQMQMQQQMQQQQMQQQMQQQQMQQQQMQQQQMQQQQMQQQQMAQTQISSSEATTMDGDSSINQKGLIPPTQYFAISSFTPRQPDELAIEQGDEVIIVQTFDDGWAFGRNSRTRMVGVLPMTFLSCTNQYNNYQYSNELPDRQSSRRL